MLTPERVKFIKRHPWCALGPEENTVITQPTT